MRKSSRARILFKLTLGRDELPARVKWLLMPGAAKGQGLPRDVLLALFSHPLCAYNFFCCLLLIMRRCVAEVDLEPLILLLLPPGCCFYRCAPPYSAPVIPSKDLPPVGDAVLTIRDDPVS